jgi:hypothetical protein
MTPQSGLEKAQWPPVPEEGMIIPGPFLNTIDEKTGEVLTENPFDEVEEDNDF